MENEELKPENAVLGCAMFAPECVPLVCGELLPTDFLTQKNVHIFNAIVGLWKAGIPVELVTVLNSLDSDGLLESAGGISYLSDLLTATITAANIRYYIGMMHETRRLRLLSNGMRNVVMMAESGDDGCYELAKKTLDEVFSIGTSQLTMLPDLLPTVPNRLGDMKRGIPTGFTLLDSMTGGLQKGHLIILAARPGVGKTALACNIAANVCRNGGVVSYYSLEMGAEEIVERINLSEAMVNKYAAQKNEHNEYAEVMRVQDRMWKWKLHIDDRGSISVSQIMSSCYLLKQKFGQLDLIIIDYLQLMRLIGKKNANTNQLLAEASRDLKLMAKELKCPIIALSQLNRSCEGREPMISDLRDSGAIEQDADIVLLLHRENTDKREFREQITESTPTALIVGKNRHGAVGNIKIMWNAGYTRFLETTREPVFKDATIPKGVFDD